MISDGTPPSAACRAASAATGRNASTARRKRPRCQRPAACGSPLKSEVAVTRDIAAQASLGLLGDAVGLTPRRTLRTSERFGSEARCLLGDVMFDAVARDLAYAAVVVWSSPAFVDT
jgi:hypothetical protein